MTVAIHKIENPQDMEAAYRIRRKVFVEEQNVPAQEEYDQHEATATHFMALSEGVPVGTTRYRVTDYGVKLERFAILKEYRNQRIGSLLLEKVMAHIYQHHPEKKVYMHSQLHAVPFYARHGFDQVGELFHECDIAHYKMEMHA